MNRNEFLFSLTTAGLAFVGAIAGVFLGSKLDQSNWERRFQIEQKRVILEKRVAILERVIVIFNKAQTMTMLASLAAAESKAADIALECAKERIQRKAVSETCERYKDWTPDRATSVAKEIHVLGAEYAAAVSLASTYFGPETRKAVEELRGSEWWNQKSIETQRIVDAMARELVNFE